MVREHARVFSLCVCGRACAVVRWCGGAVTSVRTLTSTSCGLSTGVVVDGRDWERKAFAARRLQTRLEVLTPFSPHTPHLS
jgi:hypothetical protein